MSARKLLRWVGSKTYCAGQIARIARRHLDAHPSARLVSLFYGSGAIEQVVGGPQIAAEKVPDLIAVYEELQRNATDLWVEFNRLAVNSSRTAERYLEVRAMEPQTRRERAARFLFLSGLAFNGQWRVNRAGKMNVPADPRRLADPWPFPSETDFWRARDAVELVEFHDDWTKALLHAAPGDLVISDPPYMGGWTAYTAGGFPDECQFHLAEELRRAAANGIEVIAFNGLEAAPLYSWGAKIEARRPGRMNSDTAKRKPVSELLVVTPRLFCASTDLLAIDVATEAVAA